MRNAATLPALLATVSFLLQGCGVDALRIDGASSVATTSATVVTQTNAVLDQAKARRERAYDTFIASDPSCPLTGDVYLFVPTSAPAAPPPATVGKDGKPVLPPSAPLCASGPNASFPGYRVEKMNAPVIGPLALKPTVALVGALADYEAALAKATSKTNTDLTKELQASPLRRTTPCPSRRR